MTRRQYENLCRDRPDLGLIPWRELYQLQEEARKWKRDDLIAHLTGIALSGDEEDPLTLDVPF